MPDLRERWRTSFIEATNYVAADLSPVMLRRARAEAERPGIHFIEFVEADVEANRLAAERSPISTLAGVG